MGYLAFMDRKCHNQHILFIMAMAKQGGMNMTYFCPECKGELSEETGCGSVSYFCEHCKKLISRKNMLTKEEVEEEKNN